MAERSGFTMIGRRSGADAQVGQRPSLVDGAYDALKGAIRNNVFAPGYQGSEQEIASQLGMSRTPVHEAIIRLQEEGLVRVLPAATDCGPVAGVAWRARAGRRATRGSKPDALLLNSLSSA